MSCDVRSGKVGGVEVGCDDNECGRVECDGAGCGEFGVSRLDVVMLKLEVMKSQIVNEENKRSEAKPVHRARQLAQLERLISSHRRVCTTSHTQSSRASTPFRYSTVPF